MKENQKQPAGSIFLQITFPLLAGTAAVIALGVWVVIGVGGAGISRWAEISTVLLVIPVLILSLIPLAVIAGLAAGISWLIRNIPQITTRIQEAFRTVQETASRLSSLAVKPVIWPRSNWAGLKSIFQRNPPQPHNDEIPINIE